MDLLKRILAWWRGEVRVVMAVGLPELAALAGGMEEAYILKRVMDWCASNDKRGSNRHYKEGKWWMYYSYREWVEKEVAWLTERQVERVIGKLEEKGLLIGKQFSAGGSKWYRPNLEAIKGVGVPEKGKIITFDPSRNREAPAPNRETPSPNGETPFTNRGNINSFNQSSNNGLKQSSQSNREEEAFSEVDLDKGFSKNERAEGDRSGLEVVDKLYGIALVDRVLRDAEKRGLKLHNRGGYVRKVLDNEAAKGKVSSNPLERSMAASNPHPLTPSPQSKDGEPASDDNLPDWLARKKMLQARLKSHLDSPVLERESMREKCDAEVAWERAYGQLELQLDKSNFDTWLRDVVFIKATDGVYTLQVKSTYARDMLQHRLYRNIRRVLCDVLGADVEISFVVSGEAVAS